VLVVVTPQISPFALTPSQLMVPYIWDAWSSPSRPIRRIASIEAISRSLSVGKWLGSVRCFHSSHSLRESGVLRSSSIVKPSCFANFCAPAPTSSFAVSRSS